MMSRQQPPPEGKKFDYGKVPLELLPTKALIKVGAVLAVGRDKYGAFNWAAGMKWSRLLGACLRHLFAWSRGEDKDPESGVSHLAHSACCILFLLEYEDMHKNLDDRFKE